MSAARPKVSRGIWASVRNKTLKKRNKKIGGEDDDAVCLSTPEVKILLARLRVILAHIESNATQSELTPLSSTGISAEAKEAAQRLIDALVKDDTIHLVKSLQSMSCATLGAVIKLVFRSSPEPLIPGRVCTLILGTCAKYAEYLDEKDDEKVEEIGATLERFSASANFSILEGLCQSLNRMPMPNDELAYVFAPLVLMPKLGMIVGEGAVPEDIDTHLEMIAAADAMIEAMEFLIHKADTLFDSRSRKRALIKKGFSVRHASGEGLASEEEDPAAPLDDLEEDNLLAMVTKDGSSEADAASRPKLIKPQSSTLSGRDGDDELDDDNTNDEDNDDDGVDNLDETCATISTGAENAPDTSATSAQVDTVKPTEASNDSTAEEKKTDTEANESAHGAAHAIPSSEDDRDDKDAIDGKNMDGEQSLAQGEAEPHSDCNSAGTTTAVLASAFSSDQQQQTAAEHDAPIQHHQPPPPPARVKCDVEALQEPHLAQVKSSRDVLTTDCEDENDEENDQDEARSLPSAPEGSQASESHGRYIMRTLSLTMPPALKLAGSTVNALDLLPSAAADDSLAAEIAVATAVKEASGGQEHLDADSTSGDSSDEDSLSQSTNEASDSDQESIADVFDKTEAGEPTCAGSGVRDLDSLGQEAPVFTAVVLFDYEPHEDGEIALIQGEVVQVLEVEEDGWWYGRLANGEVGVFPGAYVQRRMPGDASVSEDGSFADDASAAGISLTPRSATSSSSRTGVPVVHGKDAASALTSLLQTYSRLAPIVGSMEGTMPPLPTAHQIGPAVQVLLNKVLARLEQLEAENAELRAQV
ncbi:Class E vacuolar protein-sorting machinery protein HSE1 [Hondaea fermentalgiana]|uniref:Class E vacuolar protein-sorting machinery protein HSE1 n=1 Tax=Hondaea fermentalgiana TaxID=2315210 RepID=A0A2R5GA27_9STRA|nr:Class E vacuolar protein-sorting machinery protein HSE1 [Hondaea fermentalgiana]|eukprot:GBG27159.1 Class E vacuolar protein-sorting machinery protein HSE1 [Hondaea fermentalgiana]